MLPLESHSQQRKSARDASGTAFPPSTESFPIPQGLPALSQTPGTPGHREKETKGAPESEWRVEKQERREKWCPGSEVSDFTIFRGKTAEGAHGLLHGINWPQDPHKPGGSYDL